MTDLQALVIELRRELRGEIPAVLHTRHVPRLRNRDGGTDRDNADEGGVGMPFTTAMHRRLSHSDWWGVDELASLSILEVGDMCRSRHLSDLHRCPGRSTSLCERIVQAVSYGQPVEDIAINEGLDVSLTEQLAVKGLAHAFRWRHGQLHRYMRAARERERDSKVDCPLCIGRPVTMRRRAHIA